ncbi:MAG: hypothetical protein ACPL7K_01670 [Armatimonadota bacterium]
MKYLQNLDTKSWTGTTGDVEWSLQTLKPKVGDMVTHLAEIILRVRMDITTGTLGSVGATHIFRWFSNVSVRDRYGNTPVDGLDFYELVSLLALCGKVSIIRTPESIGANASNAVRYLHVRIPFAIPTLPDGDSYSPVTPLYQGGSIRLRLGSSSIGTNGTVNSCEITPIIRYYVPAKSIKVAPRSEIRAVTVQPYASLPDGIYLGAGLSLAGSPTLNNITVGWAGRNIIESMTPNQIYAAWTADWLDGLPGFLANDNDTARAVLPAGSDYETAAGLPLLPLIWLDSQSEDNTATKLCDTRKSPLSIEVDGPTSIRVLYWKLSELTTGELNNQLSSMQADPASVIVRKDGLDGQRLSKEDIALTPGLRAVPATLSVINPVNAGVMRK